MWEERAERARRDIAALATGGTDPAGLYASALAVVQRTVPFEQGCWAAVDPESLVMTSITNWKPWPVGVREYEEYSARFAEAEYTGNEPNNFAELLRRPRPIARMSDAPHRDVVRSVRVNDLLKPQGLEHELRAAFRVDDACWGVGSIFRDGGHDFTDREVEFLDAVTATLAAATRIAVRARPASPGPMGVGPVIVIAGPAGELRAATPAAASWLAEVEDTAPGRFSMALYSVVAQAHRAASGTARARMRDAGSSWVLLQASRLISGDDPEQMVVTVEPATTHDLAGLLLTAYGVTAREREVCLDVLSGRSTADIARHLFISPHTVHDHLKSLFEKVGVGSRGELVATLVA
ncbi:helix-turn-helix transcriptional regulator [Pseudarthrobacter phenanthrenivorans]|uniref:helix-turn-helix transcriptional regulator n=1 Tax=Pseudarthrobacter phenanthrenivorans TaxID=361575 RepID=UPI00112C0024|nr:helix-turn-helix transcriptional regulator [Pseudarthrobacter phenanthrenivorans]TPV49402.1 helix-turn-helix transcriptional regulator [Pseudarthrobacter phenanthrenivorans]